MIGFKKETTWYTVWEEELPVTEGITMRVLARYCRDFSIGYLVVQKHFGSRSIADPDPVVNIARIATEQDTVRQAQYQMDKVMKTELAKLNAPE
jgi:hypothetical protein